MLFIRRKFNCSVGPNFVDGLKSILDEFNVMYSGPHYYSMTIHEREHVSAHFDDCAIDEERFTELIERLKNAPMNAFISLHY